MCKNCRTSPPCRVADCNAIPERPRSASENARVVTSRSAALRSHDARVKAALLLIFLVACGGAPLHAVQLTNRTPRQIEQVFVYPQGASNHGASVGSLAPNATTTVKVKQGNVEVLAVSAKVQIDEHTRDQPSASQAFELKGPMSIIFYDDGSKPADVDRPGTLGIAFQLAKSNAPPPPLTDDRSQP